MKTLTLIFLLSASVAFGQSTNRIDQYKSAAARAITPTSSNKVVRAKSMNDLRDTLKALPPTERKKAVRSIRETIK